jgi:hypothetical protein
MNVSGIGGGAAIWFKTVEKDPSEALNGLVDAAASGKNDAANPAASNTSFPTRSPTALDAASMLMLQGGEEADAKPAKPSAADEFMAYMKKTPEERMRDSILKSMGMTEEELESLPPEQRKAIEDKIKELIKEKVTPMGTEGLHVADPNALQTQLQNGLPAGHQPGVQNGLQTWVDQSRARVKIDTASLFT